MRAARGPWLELRLLFAGWLVELALYVTPREHPDGVLLISIIGEWARQAANLTPAPARCARCWEFTPVPEYVHPWYAPVRLCPSCVARLRGAFQTEGPLADPRRPPPPHPSQDPHAA